MTIQEKAALIAEFKPVTIQDDLMFGTIMEDPKYCKPFLETILGVKIREVKLPATQRTVKAKLKAKSIRLDVYVEDDQNTVYDVEMQSGKKRNLPNRTWYYQSMMDIDILGKGEDYIKLKKSLIIFVCCFDPFGYDEYIYRFQRQAELSDGRIIGLGDESSVIFVNADGHKGNVSREFKTLMDYIMNGQAYDSFTEDLDRKVESLNNDDDWKVEHMTMQIKLADERFEGREEGRMEGNISTLYELYKDGLLSLDNVLAKANMSEADFMEKAKKIEKEQAY